MLYPEILILPNFTDKHDTICWKDLAQLNLRSYAQILCLFGYEFSARP